MKEQRARRESNGGIAEAKLRCAERPPAYNPAAKERASNPRNKAKQARAGNQLSFIV